MDGNTVTPVNFRMTCTDGDPDEQRETVIPNSGDSIYKTTFEVAGFTPGETDCTVYAERVPGYVATYNCGSDNNPDQICSNGDPSPFDDFGDESCYFENVDSSGSYDSVNFCEIRNYSDPTFGRAVPTLNPFNMAVLILLMMGIGLAGFRRFD